MTPPRELLRTELVSGNLEGSYAFLMGVFLRLCFLSGCSRPRGHRRCGVRARELGGWSASKQDVKVGHCASFCVPREGPHHGV